MNAKTTAIRLGPTVTAWKRPYWLRRAPGRFTLILMLVLPAAFVALPASVFWLGGWRQIVTTVLWIGPIFAAAAISRDSALLEPSHTWLYQKGVSLGDYTLLTVALDAALGLAIVLWWVAAWAVTAQLKGFAPSTSLIVGWALMVCVFFLTAQLMLTAVAGLGSTRGIEVLSLGVFLALLEPLLARSIPEAAGHALHLVLPPLLDANALRQAWATGQWGDGLAPGLHLLTFWGALLAVALFRNERWRPQI